MHSFFLGLLLSFTYTFDTMYLFQLKHNVKLTKRSYFLFQQQHHWSTHWIFLSIYQREKPYYTTAKAYDEMGQWIIIIVMHNATTMITTHLVSLRSACSPAQQISWIIWYGAIKIQNRTCCILWNKFIIHHHTKIVLPH